MEETVLSSNEVFKEFEYKGIITIHLESKLNNEQSLRFSFVNLKASGKTDALIQYKNYSPPLGWTKAGYTYSGRV